MTGKLVDTDYLPQHMRDIVVKDIHQGEHRTEVRTAAITFLLDDSPVAIIGWFRLSHSVLQVWSVLSDDVSKKPISFYKSVLNLIEYAFDSMKINRMQMSVRVGYNKGVRFAESLGFVLEGVMFKYGDDGSDYYLFSRVR